MVERVIATGAARGLLAVLENRHGPIVLQVISSKGRDIVVCRPEYDPGSEMGEVWLGSVADIPVHSSTSVDDRHQDDRLIFDVRQGAGEAASLEGSEGVRFVVRAEPLHPLERARLDVSLAPAPAPIAKGPDGNETCLDRRRSEASPARRSRKRPEGNRRRPKVAV